MAADSGSLKSVWAALVAGLTMVTLPAAASSATPTLMWSGAKRVNLLCNVAGGPGIDQAALSARLCRDVERLAATGATIPVGTIVIGDPAVLESDAVTLLIHASVTTHHGERLLAFSIRPYRSATEQSAVLFGATPRAALIGAAGTASPGLDAALSAALTETLPWLTGLRTP